MITAGVGLPGAAIIEAVSIAHGCRAQRPNQRQNNVGLALIIHFQISIDHSGCLSTKSNRKSK
jgi:hypothetical protein